MSHVWHVGQALHTDKERQQDMGGFSFHPHIVGDVDTHVLDSSAEIGVCVCAYVVLSPKAAPY